LKKIKNEWRVEIKSGREGIFVDNNTILTHQYQLFVYQFAAASLHVVFFLSGFQFCLQRSCTAAGWTHIHCLSGFYLLFCLHFY